MTEMFVTEMYVSKLRVPNIDIQRREKTVVTATLTVLHLGGMNTPAENSSSLCMIHIAAAKLGRVRCRRGWVAWWVMHC